MTGRFSFYLILVIFYSISIFSLLVIQYIILIRCSQLLDLLIHKQDTAKLSYCESLNLLLSFINLEKQDTGSFSFLANCRRYELYLRSVHGSLRYSCGL